MTENEDSKKKDTESEEEERRQSRLDRRVNNADRRGDDRVNTSNAERRQTDERREDE
jgi:hypothetical protein